MRLVFLILLGAITSFSQGQNNFEIKKSKADRGSFKLAPNVGKVDYLPKTIIFKIKSDQRSSCSSNSIENSVLNKILIELDCSPIEKKFSGKNMPERSFNENGEKLVDLSLIYEVSYNAEIEIEKAINSLYNSQIIEYAEPYYIPKSLYNTNDPSNGLLYALTNMNVFNGWDISKGDTNIVIGITDTGVDLTHSDLASNIKFNYSDPVNGVDDDGDGFTDNFMGWDLGENDNNPQFGASAHGVHVSGIAAATTDNSIGISGVAFKCKFLPVKIADGGGLLTKAYEGIVYAADMGCQIINCSWGSIAGGQFGQDVIDYATINKNALVVCGAGNNSNENKFYPSAYNYAFSVAATGSSDQKWTGSSYGYYVDVSAPGEGIYSTTGIDNYGYSSGTSMASPNAAGAAAIVKSYFPSYSALQVGEQLKVTADNIYSVNTAYIDKLGTGRINLYRALTETSSPSVVMTQKTITDNNDNAFIIGDTLNIAGIFTNYLAPVSNLTATLSSTSSFVTVLDGSAMIGAIPTLGTSNNNTDPFKVKINSNTPINATIIFKLTLSAGSYSSNYYFDVTVNVDYINIAINDVATTISSIGRIGYSKESQGQGLGFTYLGGVSLLYEGGLMIGNSVNAVSDGVRGAGATDNDFWAYQTVKKIPNAISEFDVAGYFNDNYSTSPLPVFVYHQALAWSSAGNRKYVMVVYYIKNTGSTALNNLHAGIFADWDIMNYELNKADFDVVNQMGYSWSTEANGLYAGVKLLSASAPVVHYAIDNVSGGGGGLNLGDGFDTPEKYISLSTNRPQAGVSGAGNDVMSVVSSGPYNILPDSTAVIAFALLAGDSLQDLQASAMAAQLMYDSETVDVASLLIDENDFWIGQSYPNPTTGNIVFEFSLPHAVHAQLKIYNTLGQEVKVVLDKRLEKGKHIVNSDVSSLGRGVYFYKLVAEGVSVTGKMTVVGGR